MYALPKLNKKTQQKYKKRSFINRLSNSIILCLSRFPMLRERSLDDPMLDIGRNLIWERGFPNDVGKQKRGRPFDKCITPF